jgi:glycosyltransferase involved in cell wall biosynthesis
VIRFEVRVPTYERPEFLRRALRSLQSQTYPDWTATVLDDSNSPDAARIVGELGDKRFTYIRNQMRLGAAQNIDQCISPSSRDGAEFGCLLEDDNYWLPDFLSLVASRLKGGRWNIVLANQRIHREKVGLLPPSYTTRGDWFIDGALSPLALRASLLLMEGLSNGGLIWRLGSHVDLRVGRSVKETALHEACRTLLIKEDVLFVAEAQAVWTDLPTADTARAVTKNRVVGRGMQAVRDFVLRCDGSRAVSLATEMAGRNKSLPGLAWTLAYSGRLIPALRIGGTATTLGRAWLKGLAIRCAQPNPCRSFLQADSVAL